MRAAQCIGGVAGALQLGLALMATWALLGATDASVLRLVMRPSLRLLAIGGAIGSGAGILIAPALHATISGLAPLGITDVVPAAGLTAVVVVAAA